MKRIFIILAFAMALASCKQSFEIKTNLEGSEGKWLTLSQRIDREYVVLDSALAENGQPAILSGSVDGITTLYLGVSGEDETIRMLIENAKYTVSGSMEAPVIETSAKAQTDLNDYLEFSKELESGLQAVVESYYEIAGKGDSLALDSILSVYEDVSANKEKMDSTYLAGHPASAASVMILRGSFYSYETPELEAMLHSLSPGLHEMEEYQYMHDVMERQKAVAVGKHYLDFGLPTPGGDLLKISDVHKGQVLLIDFWASWCGPCRRANPEVVSLYNEFHDRGFDVIGISLDRSGEAWLKAIEDDDLTWNHISDLKYWGSEGARLYGVSSIPHTILIDREGLIRFKKLHGEELKEAIESLL